MTSAVFDQIIPDELRQIIIDEGKHLSDSFWLIGDSTILVQAAVDAAQRSVLDGSTKLPPASAEAIMRVGVMDVYEEVAALAGISARTVREIVPVCEFYKEAMRFPYADLLRFGHFQYAAHYPDHWRKMLDACLDYAAEHGGKPPSVSWLQRQFHGEAHQVSGQIHDYNEAFELHETAADSIGIEDWDDQDIPGAPGAGDDKITVHFSPIMQYLGKLSRFLKDEETRAKLAEAMRLLNEIIEALDISYRVK